MARQRTYLKEWRKHRGLTQEQVVDRLVAFDDDKVPRTAASLSRIETGQQIYTQRILEALAEVYDVEEAGWLLDRNPLKEGEVIDLWARLNEREREQARTIIEALTRSQA